MQPYIVLAERMGAFLAQIPKGRWKRFAALQRPHRGVETELIRNGRSWAF